MDCTKVGSHCSDYQEHGALACGYCPHNFENKATKKTSDAKSQEEEVLYCKLCAKCAFFKDGGLAPSVCTFYAPSKEVAPSIAHRILSLSEYLAHLVLLNKHKDRECPYFLSKDDILDVLRTFVSTRELWRK